MTNQPRMLATLAVCGALMVTACSGSDKATTGATSSTSGGNSASAAAPTPAATPTASAPAALGTVVKAGLGERDGYAWVSAIVHNETDEVGQTVTVMFNVLAADGSILASQSQVEAFTQPKADHIIGTQVELPKGKKATKVEAALDIAAENLFSSTPFAPMPTKNVTFDKDEFGSSTVSYELSNPLPEPVKAPRLQVACFDAKKQIVGGGSDYPDLVPANGRIRVKTQVIVTGTPASCEVFTGAPLEGIQPTTKVTFEQSNSKAIDGVTADQFFVKWLDQLATKDWKSQYASMVNAQRERLSEKQFAACRDITGPTLTYVETTSVEDAGDIPIPGTTAKVPASKVIVELSVDGVHVPFDVHIATEDGQWKWMMDSEGFKSCAK